jgi:hypothetical protein
VRCITALLRDNAVGSTFTAGRGAYARTGRLCSALVACTCASELLVSAPYSPGLLTSLASWPSCLMRKPSFLNTLFDGVASWQFTMVFAQWLLHCRIWRGPRKCAVFRRRQPDGLSEPGSAETPALTRMTAHSMTATLQQARRVPSARGAWCPRSQAPIVAGRLSESRELKVGFVSWGSPA